MKAFMLYLRSIISTDLHHYFQLADLSFTQALLDSTDRINWCKGGCQLQPLLHYY